MDSQILKIVPADPGYPSLLRHIPDPPPLLYYRGSLAALDRHCVAVVGTRKMTDYAAAVTPQLVKPLGRSGITIISGLAYGVDAAAHRAALEAGGITIAVLGCGLADEDIYPPGNRRLAAQILKTGGALISEYSTGTPALRYHFLARNRIIAALSLGTLVIECPVKSGALITAKHALDYNRSIYAVPGPITSLQSAGTNQLIKHGAIPVTESQDILDDLRIPAADKPAPTAKLSAIEQKIVSCLISGAQRTDAIIEQTGLAADIVLTTLTFLEMSGIIKQLETQSYIINIP